MAPIEEWDTKNNKDAELGLTTKPATTGPVAKNVNGMMVEPVATADPLNLDRQNRDAEFLSLIKSAKASSDTYMKIPQRAWSDGYRANRNQHFSDSKYHSDQYRGRSKLHRPKTRSAVHKGDANAAAALFASSDIIEVTAANPGDEKQQASAELNKELIAYRLDRRAGRAGIPWFKIAIASHNQTQITGLTASKQYWERREINRQELTPDMDQMGQQVTTPDGTPSFSYKTNIKVVRDRPMVRLYPPEHVIRDPGADWLDQANESSFLGLIHPMRVADAVDMMKPNEKSRIQWREVDRARLARNSSTPSEGQGVTNAREGAVASRTDQRIATPAHDYDNTWLVEWFVKKDGEDWHFWTAWMDTIISEPILVEEAYPEQKGDRPVIIGTGSIEAHRIDPMSRVASILPLQQEMNDLVNLRMDGVKESIRPFALARYGSRVEARKIQNRSGDDVMFVKDVEKDLKFDRPGDVSQQAYLEMANLNADFDDAYGLFNAGSVQTNRQLNETVGGMKLFNASANVLSDFDLRVWLETWAEPALQQVVRCEQYYEDDKVLLALAGEKAKLYQKFGIDAITDELLDREITVTVSAGIGNANPETKQQKFFNAAMMTGKLLGPEIVKRVKQDAVINEIFGTAGFKDAAERFFYEGDGTDPRTQQMQEMLQKLAAALEDKQADREAKIESTRISTTGTLLGQILDLIAAEHKTAGEQQHDASMKQADRTHQTTDKALDAIKKEKQLPAASGKAPAASHSPPASGGGGIAELSAKVDKMMQGMIKLAELIQNPAAAGPPPGNGGQPPMGGQNVPPV